MAAKVDRVQEEAHQMHGTTSLKGMQHVLVWSIIQKL